MRMNTVLEHADESRGTIDPSGDYSVSTDSENADLEAVNVKQKAAEDERRTLGKRESRAIGWLRLLVLGLLVLFGFATSVSVYFLIRETEEDAYSNSVNHFTEVVIDRFNVGIERKLEALDTLSTSITSHALESNETFPFVTMPDFEYKGSNARISGDSILTLYLPYISADQRGAWEDYAQQNGLEIYNAWKEEERMKALQDEKFGLEAPQLEGLGLEAVDLGTLVLAGQIGIAPTIWVPGGDEAHDVALEAPYFPVWQMTPVLPPGVVDLINADMGKFDFAKNSLRATVATGKATLDVFTDLLSNTTEDASVFDIFLQSSQYRHSTETYTGEEPVSSLIYPVFDNFGEDKKVVGALYSTLYWKFLFSKILPPAVEGIVCVLENDLGQAVSYQINGPEVIFIGHGDQHDTTYDDLGKSVKIAEYMLKASNPETRSFTAVDLNDDYLGYTLHIYPSTTYENIYITGEALQGTLVIAGIFGVVIGMFVIYDCCVQKRQKIVMDRAVRATAVVSSLYPETIRDQIINDDANDVKQQPSRAQTFMRKSTEGIGNGSSRPLASKHPACTVYFADLAGFTKWSSTRQPEQVFQLLEALFKEFDAAALRRGVFKVETIGDCYMAVTGLPQAQPDHALRMAKFAHDCMHKIDQVTAELSKTLGEGTDDLTLRAGMHSGEVTGGVLRGEKGRFQLFGDTVNTASRMESTGIPRQIQISQSTADALILDGKENWLVPREEKVFAKGKGELQTYFLEVKERSFSSSDRASTTSASTSSGKS